MGLTYACRSLQRCLWSVYNTKQFLRRFLGFLEDKRVIVLDGCNVCNFMLVTICSWCTITNAQADELVFGCNTQWNKCVSLLKSSGKYCESILYWCLRRFSLLFCINFEVTDGDNKGGHDVHTFWVRSDVGWRCHLLTPPTQPVPFRDNPPAPHLHNFLSFAKLQGA